MRAPVRFILLLFCITSGIVMLNAQGLYWETTMSIPKGEGKEMLMKSVCRPHMFKQSGEDAATIVRLDKSMIISVDNKNKEYSEMAFSDLEAAIKEAGSSMDARMTEMKKKLESMDPEKRKMMEQMMGDRMKMLTGGGTISVKKTNETKTISGFPCVRYGLTDGDTEIGSIWTTTAIPSFKEMGTELKEFGERMMSLAPSRGKSIVSAMKNVEGFPIQSDVMGIRSLVTKVETRDVPAAEFQAPPDYKKVTKDPKEMFRMRRPHRPAEGESSGGE